MTKKLFISLPMRDRSDTDIRERMEQIRERVSLEFGVEYELVNSFINEVSPEKANKPCWFIGQSLSKMAFADLVVFATDWKEARGCIIEHMTCALYDIPYVDMGMPDIDFEPQDTTIEFTPEINVSPDNLANAIDISKALDNMPKPIVDRNILHQDIDDDYDPESDELEPGEYDADLVVSQT